MQKKNAQKFIAKAFEERQIAMNRAIEMNTNFMKNQDAYDDAIKVALQTKPQCKEKINKFARDDTEKIIRLMEGRANGLDDFSKEGLENLQQRLGKIIALQQETIKKINSL